MDYPFFLSGTEEAKPGAPGMCFEEQEGNEISEVESVCAYDRTGNKEDGQQQLQGCR
jgi:hypothetical protein